MESRSHPPVAEWVQNEGAYTDAPPPYAELFVMRYDGTHVEQSRTTNGKMGLPPATHDGAASGRSEIALPDLLAVSISRNATYWSWNYTRKAKVHMGQIPTVDLDKKLRLDKLDLDRIIEESKKGA